MRTRDTCFRKVRESRSKNNRTGCVTSVNEKPTSDCGFARSKDKTLRVTTCSEGYGPYTVHELSTLGRSAVSVPCTRVRDQPEVLEIPPRNPEKGEPPIMPNDGRKPRQERDKSVVRRKKK